MRVRRQQGLYLPGTPAPTADACSVEGLIYGGTALAVLQQELLEPAGSQRQGGKAKMSRGLGCGDCWGGRKGGELASQHAASVSQGPIRAQAEDWSVCSPRHPRFEVQGVAVAKGACSMCV